jgi:hypothetical protein
MNLIKLNNLNFNSKNIIWKFNDNYMFSYTDIPLVYLGKGDMDIFIKF